MKGASNSPLCYPDPCVPISATQQPLGKMPNKAGASSSSRLLYLDQMGKLPNWLQWIWNRFFNSHFLGGSRERTTLTIAMETGVKGFFFKTVLENASRRKKKKVSQDKFSCRGQKLNPYWFMGRFQIFSRFSLTLVNKKAWERKKSCIFQATSMHTSKFKGCQWCSLRVCEKVTLHLGTPCDLSSSQVLRE